MIKQCAICEGEFEAKANGKLCSTECRREWSRKRNLEQWHKKRENDPKAYRACVVCEKVFRVWFSRQVTCSEKCSHENDRDRENARRRAIAAVKEPTIKRCVCCDEAYEARGRSDKYCSSRCEYDFNAEKKRERCRNWRQRNPEKQKAATMRWEEQNRERHLARIRERARRVRRMNPEKKSVESKLYRRKYPERIHWYAAKRTSTYQLVRLLEKYGAAALAPNFVEPQATPVQIKQREYSRRWKERHPDYKPPKQAREKRIESQRRHQERESAAIKLIRELETKGMEALL